MRWLIALLLLADVLPCGGPRRPPGRARGALAGPDWVKSGTGLVMTDQGRFFDGVGTIAQVRNAGLRDFTAAERGRAEVARLVDAYANAWASLTSDPTAAALTATAVREVAASLLKELQPVDKWLDDEGTRYSLVRLDAKALIEKLQSTAPDQAARARLATEGAAVFDQLVTQPRQAADGGDSR